MRRLLDKVADKLASVPIIGWILDRFWPYEPFYKPNPELEGLRRKIQLAADVCFGKDEHE